MRETKRVSETDRQTDRQTGREGERERERKEDRERQKNMSGGLYYFVSYNSVSIVELDNKLSRPSPPSSLCYKKRFNPFPLLFYMSFIFLHQHLQSEPAKVLLVSQGGR